MIVLSQNTHLIHKNVLTNVNTFVIILLSDRKGDNNMKTTKTYRLSNKALDQLDELQHMNSGLTYTDIIEASISIVSMISETWNDTSRLIGYGGFELDNNRHISEIYRSIIES